ncbi:uncharacterized protein LOC129580421 [Sitodiplosis mosellana]|uniref:uncharacterized protein LOC129580421 n=1 Tax=Sitodiplosis mosellana TaxID=263140 RepID=UPI0024443076|nr:uncharacterized protein LOC129580421 [Sitodiplosis mosellana]
MHRFNRKRPNRNVTENNNNNGQVPIRTLYIAPVKPFIVNKIKGYFECFGEVESVRVHSKDEFQYGFVQFKSVESAQIALNQGWHRIGNCSVKVKAADFHHQPDNGQEQEPPNPLLIAPAQDSTSHILIALNDDCLREVFGYLDLFDLSNAANACVRFNQQAKETFVDKYKDLELNRNRLDYKPITKDQIENILNNFGSVIRTLKIDQLALDSNIPFLRIASRYCTELKQLQLFGFHITGKMKKFRPLFGKLEQLEMIYCEFSKSVKDFHSVCMEMKTLRLDSCDINTSKCIKQHFVKLKEAHLIECHNFDENAIDCFIKMNPQLTKLSIIRSEDWETSEPIRSIGRNLHQLLELEIDQEICDEDEESIHGLGQLRALKVLKLNFNLLLVTPLLKILVENKVPIEDMKLYNGDLDSKAIEYICAMKQIKKLELNENMGVLTDEHLVQLAKELPNLDVLHLKELPSDVTIIGLKNMLAHAQKLSLLHLESVYSIKVNVDDYKAMLKTVKSRREKIKLVIKITSSGDKVEVDECVLAENSDIFYIDEEIEEEPSYDDDLTFDEDDAFWSDDDDFWYPYHDSDADSDNGYGYGYLNGNIFYLG